MNKGTLFAYDNIIDYFGNFGDDLNKILFKELYGVDFNFSHNVFEVDHIAIGSIIEYFLYTPKPDPPIKLKSRIKKKLRKILIGEKIVEQKKIVVLGSGFHYEPNQLFFIKPMDFKIVRGELTADILYKHGLIKNVLLGDLGLLAPLLFNNTFEKKFELGIIPHFNDLNSPIFYDIYKKYDSNSLFINVREDPKIVIKQIASCKNIISSSLHGLIIADSYGIPSMWIENKFKPQKEELHFKYFDYYSIYNLKNVSPIQVMDFYKNYNIEDIKKQYKIDFNEVKSKQKELHEYCKNYFLTTNNEK